MPSRQQIEQDYLRATWRYILTDNGIRFKDKGTKLVVQQDDQRIVEVYPERNRFGVFDGGSPQYYEGEPLSFVEWWQHNAPPEIAPRYWVHKPEDGPFGASTYAVVDNEANHIIAFMTNDVDAYNFIQARIEAEEDTDV